MSVNVPDQKLLNTVYRDLVWIEICPMEPSILGVEVALCHQYYTLYRALNPDLLLQTSIQLNFCNYNSR